RFPDPKLDECDIIDENDVDERNDEIVIMDEEEWNLPRAAITFEEYMMNCGTDNHNFRITCS
ncbi:hypothetical protein AVEN_26879-1, partial [Araneus ventricosus]